MSWFAWLARIAEVEISFDDRFSFSFALPPPYWDDTTSIFGPLDGLVGFILLASRLGFVDSRLGPLPVPLDAPSSFSTVALAALGIASCGPVNRTAVHTERRRRHIPRVGATHTHAGGRRHKCRDGG